jgi:sugar-specific transcriptional regulator TrmB
MRIEVDLKKLQELGLTERESKVYCALISHQPILMTEISSVTSIRQSKVSETLHRLLQLGIVIVRPVGRKKFYEAVRPDDAVQHLLLRNEKEMELRRQTAAQLEQQLMSVYNASRGTPSAQDYFTFLQNPTQIIRLVEELESKAQSETLWFVKGPYVTDTSIHEAELQALRRGVRYRGIYEASEPGNREDWERNVLPYVKAGEEARVHPALPMKLAVLDRRVSLVGFMDKSFPEHRTTIVIENEGIAAAFAVCFESYWQQSVPIEVFLGSRTSESNTTNGDAGNLGGAEEQPAE